MRVMIYQDRTILITGGATGIGLALAERFVRANNKVIVCGRREAALAEARAGVPGLHTVRADVSTSQERVALLELITREHPELDILINNAGVQNHPPPLTQAQDWSQHAHEIETNLGAPMHLAMLFLPHLLSRPEAAILNVSSGLAFTLSLRAALTGTRVSVVEIIPPAVSTGLGGAGVHANAEPLGAYADDVMRRLIAGELEFGYKSSEERRNASRAELDRRYAMANGLALGSPMKRQLTTPTARE
jgi:uncharacterized oxidoreductase